MSHELGYRDDKHIFFTEISSMSSQHRFPFSAINYVESLGELTNEVFSTVAKYLHRNGIRTVETVYCMLDKMRVDKKLDDIYDKIFHEERDDVRDEVDKYLRELELQCGQSYSSTPLGIATFFSFFSIVLLGMGFCMMTCSWGKIRKNRCSFIFNVGSKAFFTKLVEKAPG
ncbi:CLUMA_CG002195, isoform A [Clunio marinus]|uniref:CLUMA_CG002195, isoform A n=1 Tax=Clunio marinus TaxID=568069 RepID=A0A1J1HLJ9_9DIPT|nr:CLUMA_CG002195, isoform A [Clunio marinus]